MPFAAQHIREARNWLRKNDPVMRELIRRIGPFKAQTRRDRFAVLARAIVGQQVSTRAAASIWRRLEERLLPDKPSAESVHRMTLQQLRATGVSRQKGMYLKDLASCVIEGRLRLNQLGRKNNEDVIAELTQVKGIGRWTAEMFLMFALARMNVLPVDDLGIKNAMAKAYQLNGTPDPEEMRRIAAPWGDYSTVACWYLWQSLELG